MYIMYFGELLDPSVNSWNESAIVLGRMHPLLSCLLVKHVTVETGIDKLKCSSN